MDRACSTNGERSIHDIVAKTRRKEAIEKTKTFTVENIKMDLREIGLDRMEGIDLTQIWTARVLL
jgi:hypothetical protein